MDRLPMTNHGYDKLSAELENLIKVERPAITKAIEEAREHGDLSENAEYQYAKEKQGFIEGRIAELQDKTARADVIDPTKLTGSRAVFGATIKLINDDTDEEVTYTLVGQDEANIDKGLISTSSPVGRAMIGKEEGDEVVVKTPNGTHTYEVIEVLFIPITD